jgi:hypothetical protein
MRVSPPGAGQPWPLYPPQYQRQPPAGACQGRRSSAPAQETSLSPFLYLECQVGQAIFVSTWHTERAHGACPGRFRRVLVKLASAHGRARHRATPGPGRGGAIRYLHHAPAHPWTVATPARVAGVSQATLARGLTDAVGEPLITYLTRPASTSPRGCCARPGLPSRRSPAGSNMAVPACSAMRCIGYARVSAASMAA